MSVHKKSDNKYFVKHEILLNWDKDKNKEINFKIKPFKKVKFGDEYYNIAYDYIKDLHRIYGKNVLTHDGQGNKLDLPIVEKPK